MIKSPCKGCYYELIPKKKCIEKCQKLQKIQSVAAEQVDELYVNTDDIFENRILVEEYYA